jgi:hypothetical protein
MAALTKARNTRRQGVGVLAERLSIPVGAAKKIFQGSLVVVNAGFAEKATAALGLVPAGRAAETVDNTGGAAGALRVVVEPGVYRFENSATDPVLAADRGMTCYIEDDQTVAQTDNGSTLSAAGKVIDVDDDGVWVQIAYSDVRTGIAINNAIAVAAGANPTKAEFDALVAEFNKLVKALEAVGIVD